jgi:glyoxylase-like metal-dependent hydrolase (beta-lactamase superfamily II)
MTYQTRQLALDLWAIEEEMVRCYLLHGSQGTLLIDACASGGEGFRAAVRAIIGDAPLRVALTHSDGDHTAGIAPEDTVLVHPAEYDRLGQQPYAIAPLWDGEPLRAGDRVLEPVLIPGHTPGSIALLDRENRRVFTGDTISTGPVYMFGAGRNLPAYIESLKRLEALGGAYDYFYTCHGTMEAPRAQGTAQRVCAEKVLAGELVGEMPGREMPCKVYGFGGASLLY